MCCSCCQLAPGTFYAFFYPKKHAVEWKKRPYWTKNEEKFGFGCICELEQVYFLYYSINIRNEQFKRKYWFNPD